MSRLLAALLLLLFSTTSYAADRIVILAPAAADIIDKLGAAELVVGKTRNVTEFPKAQQIGSHIRPNLELITALDPDLLIISSNRFFSHEMAEKINADIFFYNPTRLAEILEQTRDLARLIGREQQALDLIEMQREKLEKLQPLVESPRVIYEISEVPLTIAGSSNIIADMINTAGGNFISGGNRKLLRFNPEAVLALQPDIYIWQVGPMNQQPTPPRERGQYRALQSAYLRVEQLQYSRANTLSFDNILALNRFFSNYK
jgi:iron complex transport system substrate-binding protein